MSAQTSSIPTSTSPRSIGAWAGMIGAATFVGVFLIEGFLRPGYNPINSFVSELALGPRGWIQAANFLISGTLLLLFARGVAAEFREGKASRVGPILLYLIGFGLFVSGFFTMDPADTPRAAYTWHGIAHAIFGALVFTLAPISTFVFLRRFDNDPEWRWFAGWTLAAGIVMVIAVVLLRIAQTVPPAPPNVLTPYDGLIQRTLLVPFFAWVFAFAWGLRRQTLRSTPD